MIAISLVTEAVKTMAPYIAMSMTIYYSAEIIALIKKAIGVIK